MSSGKKWFEHFANKFSGHQQSGRRESWVGYHLSKSFDNFGWNANGKAILVSPNGKFPMFLELHKRWSKISNPNFQKENVFTYLRSSPVPRPTPVLMRIKGNASKGNTLFLNTFHPDESFHLNSSRN